MKKWIVFFVLLIAISNCKKTPTTPEIPAATKHLPNVIDFSLNPSTVLYNARTSLAYNLTDVAYLEIVSDSPLRGLLGRWGDPNNMTSTGIMNGSFDITGTINETFTLTAKNMDGQITKSVTLIVTSRASLVSGYRGIYENRIEEVYTNRGNLTAFDVIAQIEVFDNNLASLGLLTATYNVDIPPNAQITLVYNFPAAIYYKVFSYNLKSLTYQQK